MLVSAHKPLCPWRMVGIVVLLNLLAYGLMFFVLHQSRQLYQERAIVVSQNLAHLLEQGISESFNKVELALMVTIDEIAERKSKGEIDATAMNAWLARLAERLPEVSSIRTHDAEGVIQYGVEGHANPVNFANRDFFRAQRDHPDAGTIISSPFLGPISEKWMMVVSRRMNHPDGSFAGIVYGTIELEYFTNLFSALDIGSKGVIALRDRDLGTIIRYSKLGGHSNIGEKTVSPQWYDLLKENPENGTFVSSSPIDHILRTNSFRKIRNHHMYITVGLAEEDYLADWRNEVKNSLLGMVIFSILTIVASLIICRLWRRRKNSLEILEQNERMFRSLAEMSTDWFWEQDSELRFTELSGALVDSFGISPENFVGKTRWDIAFGIPDEKMSVHKALVMAHQPFKDFEYSFCNQNAEKRTISVSGVPLFDMYGKFIGYRGIGKDVTERKGYEERIQHMAQHDPLTNLPNRALFNDRLQQSISLARREGREFSLLYFDLDKFKPVNDTYGHSAGDDLLKQVANRITVLLRESDSVARLGGDEFAVLLSRVSCREDAQEVSQKIIALLTEPFILEGIKAQVSIGVSIGISIFPQDADDVDGMINASDIAMYESKKTRNCFHFYGDLAPIPVSPK